MSWLLLHGKLPTCQYLQRLGINLDDECCLCNQAKETLDHLFFDCVYARAVWTDVAGWCKINRQPGPWSKELEFLVTECTSKGGKQTMYRCVISVLVYHLWKEMNCRRLQGKMTYAGNLGKHWKFLIAFCSQKDRKLARIVQ